MSLLQEKGEKKKIDHFLPSVHSILCAQIPVITLDIIHVMSPYIHNIKRRTKNVQEFPSG